MAVHLNSLVKRCSIVQKIVIEIGTEKHVFFNVTGSTMPIFTARATLALQALY